MSMPSPGADKQTPNPWAQAQGLVFLGVSILWRRTISDLTLCTEIAERWEPAFSTWSADRRTIRLDSPSAGYFVQLSDGAATFQVESPAGYDQARIHFRELVDALDGARRQHPRVIAECQYLLPITAEFDVLLKHLETALLNSTFARELAAEVYDLAYLADFRRGSSTFQIGAGALRPHEVSKRVSARKIDSIAPVSLFYSVMIRQALGMGVSDLDELLADGFRLGSTLSVRLRP